MTVNHLLLLVAALLLRSPQVRVSAQAAGSLQYQQHNNILHFVVPEGAPNNTYLGNIRSADGQPPYLVLPAPQTPEIERVAALNINLLNGDLTTNSVLDREQRDQYHFVAIVKEPFAEIKCTVTVKDVNDNAPTFLMPNASETNFVLEMPEGQRGLRKLLPLAVDFDTPQFGIKEFRIVSGNTPSGTFQLVEHEAPARSALPANLVNVDDSPGSSIVAGVDNPQLLQQLAQQATVLIPSQPVLQSNPASTPTSSAQAPHSKFLIDLEVNQTLDRENQSSYTLVVEAIDGGQPPLLGRLMVTVNVQDINDNDPIFTKKIYECTYVESTPKGTPLIRVHADDNDLDSNGQISYYIRRHSSSSQPTNINSNSSDNVELSSSAGRFAAAAAQASGSNNGKQQRQPASQKHTRQQQQQQQANELYESGSSILVDPQTALKAKPSYEQLFEIDPVKGEITLAHQLDFETDHWHELLVEARDHGKPSRSATAIVKITVTDVYDDPPPSLMNNRLLDADKKPGFTQVPSSEASRSELSGITRISGEQTDISQNYFQNFNLINWFAQINSTSLFIYVLLALVVVACPVCLLKTKSHQPESDYNDTAGLTLTSNNGQIKQSPNHSTINEHTNGSSDNHHRHHDHQRRANGSFGGLNGAGFGTPNGKMRYLYTDSNLYHNLYQPRHTGNLLQQPDSASNRQMVVGGGSNGGTMTLHNHHAHLGSPGGRHSLEHHQFSGVGTAAHHSSSLTYAHHHSRAALLHQAHHHQSSHHLSSVHNGHNKGGTMNSIGTHHSAHPSASPLPATPNTTHSSGLPPNLHDAHAHGHGHNALLPLPPGQHPAQLPPTPCNAPAGVFAWGQGPGSTMGCFHGATGSTMDSCTAASTQPLDRWFDLGVSSQLVNAHDWCGSYDWDYLSDWAPNYHTLMPLIQADA